MEIQVKNITTQKYEYIKIKKYKKIINPKSLWLILFDELEAYNGAPKVKAYDIHKIKFIAACDTSLRDKVLLVAFYLNKESGFITPILIEDIERFESINFFLVDYTDYLECCGLTGETPLKFPDYLKNVISGSSIVNCLYDNNNEFTHDIS